MINKMEKKEVEKLARYLMIKHRLYFDVFDKIKVKYHPPYVWKLKFNNSKNTWGECDGSKRTIYLSKTILNEEKEFIKDTILHEIAHALVGCGHEHGDVWKKKAIEIGVSKKDINRYE